MEVVAWREWVGFSNMIFVILRRRGGGKEGVGGEGLLLMKGAEWYNNPLSFSLSSLCSTTLLIISWHEIPGNGWVAVAILEFPTNKIYNFWRFFFNEFFCFVRCLYHHSYIFPSLKYFFTLLQFVDPKVLVGHFSSQILRLCHVQYSSGAS